MRHSNSYIDFLNLQLDLFRRNADAINKGDLITAKTTADQLKRSVKALAEIINNYRCKDVSYDGDKQTVEQMVSEMKFLHNSALAKLNTKKNQLAELLSEFRRGKNLLTGYRSGRKTDNRLFDMAG
ncbi:hypothetical protein K9N50_00405 [bacterium]|nr:hypothetical protein [bacterium]